MLLRALIAVSLALLLAGTPEQGWAAGGKRAAVAKPVRAKKRTGLGKRIMAAVLAGTMLTGCVGPFDAKPPAEPTNACAVMQEKGIGWYKDLKAAEAKWGMPKEQILAIAFRESSLDPDARSPWEGTWYKPWTWLKPSAKGMAQVRASTLDAYNKAAGNDYFSANPDKPATAFDIIGWHGKQTTQEIGKPHLIKNPKVVAQMHHGGSGVYGSSKYMSYAQDVAKWTAKYKEDFAQCGPQLDQEARPLLQKLGDALNPF